MITSRTRLVAAAISQCLAIVSFFTAPFTFSGNAERYVEYVVAQKGHIAVAGALMAFALVVSLPVCWRGNNLQRFIAMLFILMAGIALAVTFEAVS